MKSTILMGSQHSVDYWWHWESTSGQTSVNRGSIFDSDEGRDGAVPWPPFHFKIFATVEHVCSLVPGWRNAFTNWLWKSIHAFRPFGYVRKIHLLFSRGIEMLHKLLTLVNLKRRIGRCTQLRVECPEGLFIVSSARSHPAATSNKFRRRWEEGRGWQVVVKSGICKFSSQGQKNMFNT